MAFEDFDEALNHKIGLRNSGFTDQHLRLSSKLMDHSFSVVQPYAKDF